MAADRVSIVIPCFNSAAFLAETIESALAQTVPVEVIVVDDGSTDDSLAIARAFATVNVVSQTNTGVGSARNHGLQLSHGDFILFLDSDDRLLPNAVAVHLESFAQHPRAPMVYGCNRLIDETGQLIGENLQSAGIVTWRQVLFGAVPTPTQSMFRRTEIDRIGGFPPRRQAEDFELYLRLGREGDAYCHGQLVCDYRKHGNQATARPATLLAAVLDVINSTQPLFGEDDQLWRSARHHWRRYYGRWIPAEVVRASLRRDWSRLRQSVSVYVRNLPGTALGFTF